MRPDHRSARRPWRDSDWCRWDAGASEPRRGSDKGASRRELRWRRRAAWELMHYRRHHQGRSLGGNLLAMFIVASLLSILLAALVLETAFNWHRSMALSHALSEQVDWIESHLAFDAAGTPVALREPPDTAWVYTAATRDWKYRVVDGRGVAVLSSDTGAPPFAPTPADAARERFDVVVDGLPLHVVSKALTHAGHRYVVQAAISDRAAALFSGAIVGPILQNALLIAAVSLLLFAFGIHGSLRHFLLPLRRASEAASRIAPRNLETRLSEAAMPRELRPLIRAFNEALDRLQQGYRVQQEFLASAAHELKTPLALIRGQVELSESADRELLLGDIDRMARQVAQLLHLAEVSEARNFQMAETDLGGVAGEAVAFLQRLAQRGNVHLDLRLADALPARRADRGAVFVLLKNLIENALQHSPSGAVVTVDVRANGLSVRDEGDGIPPEHLPELFKRFWRGAARRDTGAGLGLAICHEIALAHGWSLVARNGTTGAEFLVSFDAS
ncbi:sensor histidine kinase [Scleromatobacter humisilvae]|uniref:histidine kinase n=1 Tax=Scleromatobacter humisilvae TaxID=2897159 RepID=A0A9X2C0S8_9BURK|nr:ATP-binding protein [Scleromatobacter humisilvae]MCK9685069.1 HAMP domain-containing histidine kinase [Scleromatobacter humisilvae]